MVWLKLACLRPVSWNSITQRNRWNWSSSFTFIYCWGISNWGKNIPVSLLSFPSSSWNYFTFGSLLIFSDCIQGVWQIQFSLVWLELGEIKEGVNIKMCKLSGRIQHVAVLGKWTLRQETHVSFGRVIAIFKMGKRRSLGFTLHSLLNKLGRMYEWRRE